MNQEIVEELPQGNGDGAIEDAPVVDVADQPDPDGESVAEELKEKIFLAGQEFDNEEQAEAYVRNMQNENVQVKAYNEGLLAATTKGQAPEVPAVEIDPLADITEDDIWQDPKAAFTKVYKRAKEDAMLAAKNDIERNVTEKSNREKIWKDFYEENPDLSAHGDYVNYVMLTNKNTIGEMELSQGLQALARKVRGELGMANKVQRELPNKSKPTPSGATKNVTQEEKAPEHLDFKEQISRIRKQRGLSG